MIEAYLSGVQILPTDPLCLADVPIVIDATVRSRKTATLTIRSRDNSTSPQAGQEVTIFAHGGTQKFGGYIDSAPRVLDHLGQRDHAVTCRDYSSICDLRSAGERVYLNAKLNDIVRDLVTDSLATDGVGLTNVAAGGGPTIEKLEIDYSTVAEAVNAACKQAGYEWEIDNDKEFRLFQPSAGSSLGTLNDTTVGIIDDSVRGKESLAGYANKVVVVLSRVLIDAPPETFDGSHPSQPTDGSRQGWTVAYPVNSVPAITVNGVAKTVGLADVDTGKDWYWQASSAVIRQDAGGTVLTSSDTLEFVYIGEQSQQVFAQDSAEIAVRAAIETRSGVYEKIIRSSTPVAATDAQGFANAVLAELKQVPYEIEFEAQGLDFNPGEKWTLGFSGHPTGAYLVTRVQWFTVGGSWDSAASSPQARQRVFLSKGVLTRDIYESWKEAFGGGSGSVTVSGGSSGGGSAPAENVSTASATVFYEADRWGIDLTVAFGASRANIARAIVYVRGPIGGDSIDREAYSFIPPASGSFTARLGGEWLRGGASTDFKVVVETLNVDGNPTASPVESSVFSVLPMDTASQASAITVTSFTTTANADGIEVFGFNLAWTQANVDTSHTEIYIEAFDVALGGYREEELYVQTGPGGGDNGFAITGKGQWIDATPSSARNYRLTFYTINTAGERKPSPATVVVSVSPGAGSLKLNRVDLATVGDALTVSGGKLLVSDLGITSAKLAALAVTTAKLAANAVDTSKLAALAVTANELASSSVTATKIASAAVGSAAIANLAVGNAAIADAAITAVKIQDATITSAKIASLNADKINAGTITVGAGGMTFSGTGGISISSGAALTTINSAGASSPSLFASASGYAWSIVGGFSGYIDYTSGMSNAYINANQYRIGGTEIVSSSRNASFQNLKFTNVFQPPISTISALSVPATYNRALAVYDSGGSFFGYIPIFF